MTKEELTKELAVEKERRSQLEQVDKARRDEFAKAFHWFKRRSQYTIDEELRNPTWTEVFIELGKLLAAKTFYNLEGNVSELECAIEDMKKQFNEKN